MQEKKIKLSQINLEKVVEEIGNFVCNIIKNRNKNGCVIGLSGGVDSTATAALIKKVFCEYNNQKHSYPRKLELVGYILPSDINDPADEEDGIEVAERLGMRYEVISIEKIVEAYGSTNPEIFSNEYHLGNLMSRIRANILSTKAAIENKLVAGTGNKDEDFGIGYYTLFGDGAVHFSPIGNLSKRLVRQMAEYLGFADIADRVPTAGLEPGQTDFKDLGYSYDAVELVTEGIQQGFSPEELIIHSQVVSVLEKDLKEYKKLYGDGRINSIPTMIDDIVKRHNTAVAKAQIIHPPAAPVSLQYK